METAGADAVRRPDHEHAGEWRQSLYHPVAFEMPWGRRFQNDREAFPRVYASWSTATIDRWASLTLLTGDIYGLLCEA